MNKGFAILPALVILAIISGIGGVGYQAYRYVDTQNDIIKQQLDNARLGAFRPSNYVGKLLTRLNEGGAESTFNTTPGTAADGTSLTTAKLGDFMVFTINPGAANEEKISVSAVSVSGTTATWTIITRGLSFTENAQVTANVKQHAIGETVIISNDDHYLVSQYVNTDDSQTISGLKTFSTNPLGFTAATNTNQFITKAYADALAIQGSATSTINQSGIGLLATGAQAAAGTYTLSSPYFLSTLISSSTYFGAYNNQVIITKTNGGQANTIDPNFISTSSNYTWSGTNLWAQILANSSTGTSTFSGGLYASLIGAPYFNATSTTATSTFAGGVKSLTASSTNLSTDKACNGCIAGGGLGYEQVSNSALMGQSNGEVTTVTATCSAGKIVISGGFTNGGGGFGGSGTSEYALNGAYRTAINQFSASTTCETGSSCTAGALVVYAICVNP